MPRPKFIINHDSVILAAYYIGKKLLTTTDREESYGQAFHWTEQPEALNSWCEQHLDTQEWIRLKNYLRDRKRRAKNQVTPRTKTVTLTIEAHKILSGIAQDEQCTLSDVVESHLAKRWLKAMK